MGNNKTAMIRRFIAIGLTLLALLFMVWPAIASVASDEREEYVEAQKWWKEYKKEHKKSEMIKEAVEEFMEDGFSKSDAKKVANASYTVQELSVKTDYSLAQLTSMFSSTMTIYTTYEKYGKTRYYSSFEADRVAFTGVMAVLLNISVWSLLVVGIGAMVLYFFNKTRALGIVFTVLAFLNTLYIIIMLVAFKQMKGDITVPGASMFLIPIFALAACIVYQRSKPAKKGRSAAQPMNNQWTQPQANNQWAQQPAEAVWTCPVCGGKNPVTAGFCANCGTKQPAKQTDWFCPVCGSKNPVTAGFCANCGTKQP